MNNLKPCLGCARQVDESAPACPGCGRPSPTKKKSHKLLWAGGAFGVLILVAMAGGGSSTRATSTVSNIPTAAEAPPIQISAPDLYRAYDANEAAADALYRDRRLLVTGTVEEIRKDILDNVVVDLHGGPSQFFSVAATLDESEAGAAASLTKHQRVTVLCTGAAKIMMPQLKNCVLQ